MNIVSTHSQKEQDYSLEALSIRKAELKQEINNQKLQIVASTEHLLSPTTISSYFLKSISKGLNLTSGLLIGYKIIKTFKNLFSRS